MIAAKRSGDPEAFVLPPVQHNLVREIHNAIASSFRQETALLSGK
jgi:hypothetical protein